MNSDDWKTFSKECIRFMKGLDKYSQDVLKSYQVGGLMNIGRKKDHILFDYKFEYPLTRLIHILETAPTLPKSCITYRGVDIIPNNGDMFHGLPVSTTIHESYAIEWLLTQKKKTSSVIKIHVPKGTPCLFFGVPPNVSANTFNTSFWNQIHINGVKNQGELVLLPCNLKVFKESVKSLHMNNNELNMYGRHIALPLCVNLKHVLSKKDIKTPQHVSMKTICNTSDWKVTMYDAEIKKLERYTPEFLKWNITGRPNTDDVSLFGTTYPPGSNHHIGKSSR